jgi:hypothetical protein
MKSLRRYSVAAVLLLCSSGLAWTAGTGTPLRISDNLVLTGAGNPDLAAAGHSGEHRRSKAGRIPTVALRGGSAVGRSPSTAFGADQADTDGEPIRVRDARQSGVDRQPGRPDNCRHHPTVARPSWRNARPLCHRKSRKSPDRLQLSVKLSMPSFGTAAMLLM